MSTKEITTQQKVVILKGDIQLWMDADRADALANTIAAHNFDDVIKFDGRSFTKSMVQGIFLPEDITEQTKRKNGQWKCKGLNWHDRGERCECASQEEKKLLEARMEAIEACGKCEGGYVRMIKREFDPKNKQNMYYEVITMKKCECISAI